MPEATLPEGAPEQRQPMTVQQASLKLEERRQPAPKEAKPAKTVEPAEPAPEPVAEEEVPEAAEAETEPTPEPTDPAEPSEPTEAAAIDVPAVAKFLGIPAEDIVVNPDGTVSFKTKINGQDGVAPLSDLRKSLQLDSSFTQKSMLLADERRQFDEQKQAVATDLGNRQQALAAGLQIVTKIIQGEFADVPWEQLKAQNFPEYLRVKDLFETRQQQVQALHSQLGQADRERLQAEQVKLHEWRQNQAKDIVNHFPTWKDPKIAETALQGIYTKAKSVYGITQAELEGLYDSRYVRILDAATKWEALQAKQVGVMQRVNQAPALAKPGTTGKPNTTPAKELRAKLSSTHSMNDGVAALLARRQQRK